MAKVFMGVSIDGFTAKKPFHNFQDDFEEYPGFSVKLKNFSLLKGMDLSPDHLLYTWKNLICCIGNVNEIKVFMN
jgi:hypothetical protein